MKIIRLGLMVAALCVAGISCKDDSVNELETVTGGTNDIGTYSDYKICWQDSFDSSSELKKNWMLIGNPEPNWKETANGQQGLFDNNGASPTSNFAVSNLMIKKGGNYIVETEIMLNIYNPDGSCVCPGVAVSRDEFPLSQKNEIPFLVSMRVIYAGTNAVWLPEWLRGHTWIVMQYLSKEEQTFSSYIPSDLLNGDWHQLKISVTQSGNPTFFCDDKVIWAPDDIVMPMNSDKKVILGYTSGGDPENLAGVAYHNWIQVSYTLPVKEE
jgi:hypothetical protein